MPCHSFVSLGSHDGPPFTLRPLPLPCPCRRIWPIFRSSPTSRSTSQLILLMKRILPDGITSFEKFNNETPLLRPEPCVPCAAGSLRRPTRCKQQRLHCRLHIWSARRDRRVGASCRHATIFALAARQPPLGTPWRHFTHHQVSRVISRTFTFFSSQTLCIKNKHTHMFYIMHFIT
jgi:hypothetical protein